jgi:hypothetical protein
MKFVLLLFLSYFINSSIAQSIPGKYISQGIDYAYELNLNSDSTFILFRSGLEGNYKCVGKWSVTVDTIFIKCKEASLNEVIKNDNITTRGQKLIILETGNLKLDLITLKRKE